MRGMISVERFGRISFCALYFLCLISHGYSGAPTLEVVALETFCDVNDGQTTYSVIVVADNEHPSNLFRDRERVCTYSRGVIAVQVASPEVQGVSANSPARAPFRAVHTHLAEKRVRTVHTSDMVKDTPLDIDQIAHLQATCSDTREKTILVVTDETCERKGLPWKMPSACYANVMRHYPINAESREKELRNAYLPLGPRDTFPFVQASRRKAFSERSVFFNLEVSRSTSTRRNDLISVAEHYQSAHTDISSRVQEGSLTPEAWQELLLDSKFTLCPGGHNPETFRMFEALEAGSIPIVSVQDYLDPAHMAPFPCGKGQAAWNTVAASPFAKAVSVESWDDLPALLEQLSVESVEVLEQLQADSMAWYEALMRRSYLSVLEFGNGYEMWPQLGPVVLEGFPPSSQEASRVTTEHGDGERRRQHLRKRRLDEDDTDAL